MGNLKRETESPLIAAQKKKNAIRSNYIIAKIDKTQHIRFCVDRDKLIDLIICEFSKLAQREY